MDKVKEDVCVKSDKSAKTREQYKILVNEWMCTNECGCYEGADKVVQTMWEGYGNPLLFDYGRNKGPDNIADENNQNTYGFKWETTMRQSVSTFKQCYEEVIKPKGLYPKK